jgi:hypothetical protein
MTRNPTSKTAARKPRADIANIRRLLQDTVSKQQWIDIIKAAVKTAKEGGIGAGMARQFLAAYTFGLPSSHELIQDEPEPIKTLVYELPYDPNKERLVPNIADADAIYDASPSGNGVKNDPALHPHARGDAGRQDEF